MWIMVVVWLRIISRILGLMGFFRKSWVFCFMVFSVIFWLFDLVSIIILGGVGRVRRVFISIRFLLVWFEGGSIRLSSISLGGCFCVVLWVFCVLEVL